MDPKKKLCVVPPCRNLRFDLVHKFPMCEQKAEMWRSALNLPELANLDFTDIRKRFFVCSRHFLSTDYKNLESRSLNWNAVPSINLIQFDNPNCLDTCTYDVVSNKVFPYHVGQSEQSSPAKLKMGTEMSSQTLPQRLPAASTTITPSNTHLQQSPQSILKRSSPLKILQRREPGIAKRSRTLKKSPEKIKKEALEIELRPLIKFVSSTPPKNNKKPLPVIQNVAPIQIHDLRNTTDDTSLHNISLEFINFEDSINLPVPGMEAKFLTVPGLDTPLDFIWLRDHCQCPACYNHATNQRRIAIRDIPLDIRPDRSRVDGSRLYVTWPDGHESEYAIDELSKMLLNHRIAAKPKAITWNKETIQRYSYARVAMTEYLTDDKVAQSVVQSLVDYGVAFVEKVPANATFTEIVIKHLFAVHRTHFGDVWTFSDSNIGFLDTAYTSEPLPAHTDNTYFSDASGLQVLHCIEYEAEGGLSLLVDGFRVLENLKANSPEVYERLKKYQVPAENKDKSGHHTHTEPIIIEDPVDGQFQQIRYNIADRAAMNTLSMQEMRQFYADLQVMAKEVENPANEWWFPLKPGTVMFFNNWRLLHGRSEFKGKRVMCGSYVSRTEFMSVARMKKIVP